MENNQEEPKYWPIYRGAIRAGSALPMILTGVESWSTGSWDMPQGGAAATGALAGAFLFANINTSTADLNQGIKAVHEAMKNPGKSITAVASGIRTTVQNLFTPN